MAVCEKKCLIFISFTIEENLKVRKTWSCFDRDVAFHKNIKISNSSLFSQAEFSVIQKVMHLTQHNKQFFSPPPTLSGK